MYCNNIIKFENLIKTPLELEYFDNNAYAIVANTDNLYINIVPVEYPVSDITQICDSGKLVSGTVTVNEVRVSGYLVYSVATDSLFSHNPNLQIDPTLSNVVQAGWLSNSAVIPISSSNQELEIVPYMVVGNISPSDPNPTDLDIKVVLKKLDRKFIINESGSTLILLEGEFEISIK